MDDKLLLLLVIAAICCIIAAALLVAGALASYTLAKALMGLLRQLYGEEEHMNSYASPGRNAGNPGAASKSS